MSDPSFTAATLELAATIEDLRQALPKPPVTSMGRAGFDALPLAKQAEFVRRGGRVFDPAGPDRTPLVPPAELPKVLLRSVWERWPSADQARFVRNVGKLHDR
jgi:hypothetical protein